MQFYRVGDYYHYHSLQISEHLHPSRISIKDMEDGRVRFSLDLVGRSKNLDIQEHFAIGEVVDRFGNGFHFVSSMLIKRSESLETKILIC